MTDEEPKFSRVIEDFLTSRGILIERIPESTKRTPDYLIKLLKRNVLMELKIKSDDPDDIAQSEAILESGGIASRSKPLKYMNNASGVISSGAKQMIEYDPDQRCHHVLWLHASGFDSYAHEEQLRFTLYGTQRLFSSKRPELIHCFFFHDSEFWRYRKTLAAAIVSNWSSTGALILKLCLNPHYERKTEFCGSELYNAFGDGLLDIDKMVDGDQVLLMDGSCDRKNSIGVLKYLRNKYRLDDLQEIDLGFEVAGMRVPKTDEAKSE